MVGQKKKDLEDTLAKRMKSWSLGIISKLYKVINYDGFPKWEQILTKCQTHEGYYCTPFPLSF